MAAQAPLRKNPHSKNGFGGAGRAAVAGLVYGWSMRPPDPRGSAAGRPALMSGSVTSQAGWVESSESNSFHTYLMLVTVAETPSCH